MLNATLPILDSFEDLERFNSLISTDSWIGVEKKNGFFSKTWKNFDGTSFNQDLIGATYKSKFGNLHKRVLRKLGLFCSARKTDDKM